MKLFRNKDQPKTRQARQRQPGQLGSRVSSTIPYSEPNRITRTDVNGQGRDRNALRQMETINEITISKFRAWSVLSGLVIVLLALIVGLSISSRANVIIIQPPGFNYLPHSVSQYQQSTATAIDSSIFNRFKPTISSADIASALTQKYPEIAYAAVTVPLFGFTPTVHIQLSKPVLIYTAGDGSSYLVNDNGLIITDAQSVQANELKGLPRVNSVSSISLKNRQVLAPQSVIFIETVAQALAVKKIQISKMNLVPMAEELDVYPAGVPYYIKFNLHQTDALSQVGTYLAAVATLQQQNITPSQYIDVQLDGRAYYK